jgi:hypothetical protein
MAGIPSRQRHLRAATVTAPALVTSALVTSALVAPALVALVVAIALALAGCGGTSPNANASPSGDGQFGGAPSGSASATTTGGSTPSSGPTSPLYPTTAKAYAQELLKAWSNKNYSRLDQLAVVSAVAQIKDSITYGGLPNTNWHYINCDGAAGTTHCTFRNDNGDETVIALNNSQIGHPTAVTEAPLDRTVYATSPGPYVANFIGAWSTGNRQRMLAYSTQAVVDYAAPLPAITSYNLGCSPAGSKTNVMIYGIGDDLGKSDAFVVDTALASAGKKHAIVDHTTVVAAPSC